MFSKLLDRVQADHMIELMNGQLVVCCQSATFVRQENIPDTVQKQLVQHPALITFTLEIHVYKTNSYVRPGAKYP